MKVVERKYTTIRRDADGNVIRSYDGIDMKAVYKKKSIVYKFIKRIADIIISAIALLILSPIFLVLAIVIKLEDGGPIFFSDFFYFNISIII